MALTIGDQNANSGMTKAIYDELGAALELGLSVDSPTLNEMREGWRKLAFAVATGVITHIQSNLEVRGVQTSGNIAATVSGSTATQNNVVFTQSNDGAGRVA
jgi:hypothetical protein